MFKKTLLFVAVIFFAAINYTTFAQDAAEESVAETEAASPLKITGYVDSYYLYNLANPPSQTNGGRIFDIPHNQFSLGLVQTMFTYETSKSSVVVDLTYGPNAQLGNFGNTADDASINIKQAYFSYSFTDKLALTVGQYGTHIGYELIDAPANFNYSLSYLFGNGPFYHTGAKLDYAISDKVGVMLGVVNGWDGLTDFNDQKSITAQVSLAPAEGLDIYLNWIGGDEYNTDSGFGTYQGSFTSLFDFTGTFQATDEFLIGLNAAYGSFTTGAEEETFDPYSKDGEWGGVALYLNYQISEKFGLGFRGERFEDPDGIRYFGTQFTTGLTLTGDIALDEGRLKIKPEIRYDTNNGNFFEDGDGNPTDTQTTIGTAFIYAF